MRLSQKLLADFVGGQAAFLDGDRYVFRGEIEEISLKDNRLLIVWTWLAKWDRIHWVKADQPSTRTDYFTCKEIGMGRLELSSLGKTYIRLYLDTHRNNLSEKMVVGL